MVSGSRRIPLVNHLPGCSGARRLAFGSILNQFMEVDAGCGKFPRTLVASLIRMQNCRSDKARTGWALLSRGRLSWCCNYLYLDNYLYLYFVLDPCWDTPHSLLGGFRPFSLSIKRCAKLTNECVGRPDERHYTSGSGLYIFDALLISGAGVVFDLSLSA